MVHFQRKLTVAALTGLVLLVSTGCGASPTAQGQSGSSSAESSFAAFDKMDDATRMDELVKAAEAEGKVTVYLRANRVGPEIEAAFEKKYDIDLTLLAPGTVQVVRQQIMEQSKAGRLEADVVETYMHELSTIYKESNLVTEIPKFLAASVANPEYVESTGIEVYQYAFLKAWNENLVTDGSVPKTLSDMTKPFWSKKLVMVKNYEPWYMTEFQRLIAAGMSVTEFEDLFKKLAAAASFADSSNPASAGIVSGQYLGGPGISLTTTQTLGTDAPIAWEPVSEPVSLIPVGVGLLREAPHPAAALLFSHWYLTEGSDIVEKEQFVEQNPNEKDLRGATFVRPDYSKLDSVKLAAWRTAYENLLKGSGEVLPEYVK